MYARSSTFYHGYFCSYNTTRYCELLYNYRQNTFLLVICSMTKRLYLYWCATQMLLSLQQRRRHHGGSSSSTASLVVLLCMLLLQCAYTAAFDAPAEGIITHIQCDDKHAYACVPTRQGVLLVYMCYTTHSTRPSRCL